MEQSYQSGGVTPRRSPETRKRRKKRKNFKRSYLIFLSVLVALSVFLLIYVHGALSDYESAQPQNILFAQVEKLRQADKKGKFEEILSMDAIRSDLGASEEEVDQFKKEFLASKIGWQENRELSTSDTKTLDVLSDGCKVATFTLKHMGQENKLLIFTLDRWKVEDFRVCGYEVNFNAPSSAIIKNHGETVPGTATDSPEKLSYSVCGLQKPEITICDVMGNSVPYDQSNLPTFTDYKITVPSNFTVKGVETVPVSAATLEPIEELKNVKAYCPEVPDTAVYMVSLLAEDPQFQILDGAGDPVEFQMEGRKVTITDQVGKSTLSLNVGFNPMDVAKMWSQFMTRDLQGNNHGYATLSPHLIPGSYLQKVAQKWANGVDITFISDHTLQNPPFHTEQIGNYVVYSENCFSCDVNLQKTMHLTRTGQSVEDKIHDTFYFVKQNGQWYLADYREIV